MPDVGVLNLQIRDNSMQAAQGLSRLANVLKSIKASTTGLRLTSVATGINKIRESVAKINNSDLQKLKILTAEIQKLQAAAGSVNGMRISFGSTKAGGSASSGAMEQAQAIRDMARDASTAMGHVGHRIQQDNEQAERFASTMEGVRSIIQNTGWTAQATAEQFQHMFMVWNAIRSSGALGGGTSPLALGDGTGGSGAGWTYWKDGAIEVEGYVDDVSTSMNRLEGSVDGVSAKLYSSTSESVGSAMEQIKMLAMQYEAEIGRLFGLMFDETGATRAGADIEGLSKQIDDYDSRISELAEKYKELESMSEMSDMAEPFAQTSEVVDEVRESFERTTSAVHDYNEAIEFARQWNAAGASRKGAYNGEESADIQYINNLIQTASQADLLAMRIDALRDKLYQMASSGKASGDQIARMVSQIQALQGKLDAASGSANDVKRSLSEIMIGSNGLEGAFKRMFPTISGLAKRFGQLIKYRMLRAVIKEIADGFREGTENYYRYSDAIGGEFAKNMDAATSSLAQMKNSIGAAAAPLINSLIPYLQMAVHWFIEAVNYANQFIALLRGQSTWSRATEQSAKAFETTEKAAKGAGGAVKDLLADWDELNIIQSQSGGSGSGIGASDAKDYATMFEEVGTYNEDVKNVVDYVKDHFDEIMTVAKAIGAAILAWKVSKAFGGVIGQLGKLAAGISLEIVGITLSYGAGWDAGLKGQFDTADIVKGAVGTLAAGIGGTLIFGGPTGFAIGIGVGLIAMFTGWLNAREYARDIEKWGELHRTAEEIDEYVKSQFSFDVEAYINLTNAHIEGERKAREAVHAAFAGFSKSLDEATIVYNSDVEISIKAESIRKAAGKAQDAIAAIEALISTTHAGFEYTVGQFDFKDSNGNTIDSAMLESLKSANSTLESFFTGMGKDLAGWILKGEKSGWKNGEMEQVLALMESQKRIIARAEELRGELSYRSEIETGTKNVVKDNVIDRETAEATLARQKEILQEVEDTTRKQRQELHDNYIDMAALAQAAAEEVGLDTDQGKELKKAADTYTETAKTVIKGIDDEVEKDLADTKRAMAKAWTETLSTVYGEDIERYIHNNTDNVQRSGMLWHWIFGGETDVQKEFKDQLEKSGIGGVGKLLYERLKDAMTAPGNDPTGAMGFLLNELGANVYDLLNEDTKRLLMSNLTDLFGDASLAGEIFQQTFGLTFRDIEPYISMETEPTEPITKNVPVDIVPVVEDSGDYTLNYGVTAESLDDGMTVPIDHVDFVVDAESTRDAARQAIEEAMGDGVMDTSEAMNIMTSFGAGLYEELMKELQYNLDEEGRNRGGLIKPGRMIASAGMTSGVSFGGSTGSSTQMTVVEPMNTERDNAQEVTNVARGVQLGNGTMLDALQALLRVAESINRKEFTVKITPNSGWGAHNARSETAYDLASGR